MKKDKYTLKLVLILLTSSFVLYLLNYLLFKDLHHIVMFLTEDMAFIPIEVLITVLLIENQFERREKKHTLQKTNLLIEIFFEEIGNELLKKIAKIDTSSCKIGTLIPKDGESINRNYRNIEVTIHSYNCRLLLKEEEFKDIHRFLYQNKESFLRFLESPHLSEHDAFTELLQSVFHLYKEGSFRLKKESLSKDDLEHLSEDVSRVYKLLAIEWAVYMKYIENEYPFLYSLALENVPFNKE